MGHYGTTRLRPSPRRGHTSGWEWTQTVAGVVYDRLGNQSRASLRHHAKGKRTCYNWPP